MKSKPFHFRYVNEVVGGFVIFVVLLLVAAVVVAGRAQGWFEPVYKVQLLFSSEGSFDLQIGSPVVILGTTVGRVEEISVDEEGYMSAMVTVKGDFFQFIRTDSMAKVKKKFGIAGDAFVEISRGSVGERIASGDSLAASKDTDINELLTTLLDEVKKSILPLLDSVKGAADQYNGLAADLRVIVGKIESGQGPAGMLVNDEATAQRIKDLLDETQKILSDIRGATVELPPMARTVNKEVQDLPGTMLLTQETLRETEQLIEGIQRHWLLRKYMKPQEPPPALISVHDIPRNVASPAPVKEEQP